MLNYEWKDGEQWNLVLKGDLDIYSCEPLREDLIKKLEQEPKDLVIDAEQLDYLDSTGIGVLISVYKLLEEKEKTIRIENVKTNVAKILKIANMDQLMTLEK